MKFVDISFPTPHLNLACDEVLVQWSEESCGEEILRFWEPQQYFVVLGYSGRALADVDLPSCDGSRVPVLRRLSGGGTVLQGPGCLNYSLILKIHNHGALRGVSETNRWIMEHLKNALEPVVGPGIKIQGISDLALGGMKFSGNAQYRRRDFLLFHGTFLLGFDIPLVKKFLPIPKKQPPYRQDRSHEDFLTNLHLPALKIKGALRESWGAKDAVGEIPLERIEGLAERRYTRDEWTFRFL